MFQTAKLSSIRLILNFARESQLELKRVVVFGHLPNTQWSWRAGRYSHTHSYIHAGYFRAFTALGYETYWLDGKSAQLANLPLDGTLFFTEGQVEAKIPLSSKAGYITHSSSSKSYEAFDLRRLHLFNYVADLRNGDSFGFPGSKVEKINDVTYVDAKSKALYQPWATNLLPDEIDTNRVSLFDPRNRDINYVGTIGHDNISGRISKIKRQARDIGVRIRVFSGVDDSEAEYLTRNSRVGMDIRGDWHLERGYVPCRAWKTLSYGKHLTSNSPLLSEIFGDRIHVEPNLDNFLDTAISSSAKASRQVLVDNMKWVKENHTFVNRASRCVQTFQELCC